MISLNINLKKSAAYLAIAVALTSCNSGNNNLTTFTPSQVIEKYNSAYNPAKKTSVYKNPAVYLDYSSGMKVAFADKNTASFYELFINSLKISVIDFYEVDKFNINKIENLDKSELYKKVKDAKKFSGINAPLNQAVSQIVKQKQPAVFITDGELWENGERNDPWAREEFETWLKDGNTLEFFITNHFDAGKEKHLFYIFFVPRSIAEKAEGMSADFLFYLNNSIEAKQFTYSHFAFTSQGVEISKDYNLKTGGVNANAAVNEETYISKDNWEYMEFYSPWKSLYKYISQAYDNNGNLIQGGAPLTSKLFVDFSGMQFYTIKQLSATVENITDDINNFVEIEEIKANPPVFATDENGKQIFDPNNNPVLINAGHYAGYGAKGELIKDTIFKAKTNLSEVKGVFNLAETPIKDDKTSTDKRELCLKLNSELNASALSQSQNNIFKITIKIDQSEVKSGDINLRNFIWQGKQVSENRSMYNSILGALNAAKPNGKTIYTYYINTLPYKN